MNLSIPKIGTPFLDENKNVTREWFLFLSGIIQMFGGAKVFPGITPVTVQIAAGLQSLSWDAEPTEMEQIFVAPKVLSLTMNGIVVGQGTGDPITTSALTNGQILIGLTGSPAVPQAISGDAVLSSAGVLTVTVNAITNTKLAQMAALTLKGNNTSVGANPTDLTVAQVNSILQTVSTWIPTDGSGAGLTFSGVSADYTQVGNLNFVYGTLTYPPTGSVSQAIISSLPIAVPNKTYAEVPCAVLTTATIPGGIVLVPKRNTSTATFDVNSPAGPVTNSQLSSAAVNFIMVYPNT